MARNTIYLYTEALDPADAVVTAQENITAADFPVLTLGDTPEFTFLFTDGTDTWPTWAGDNTYTLVAGLGTAEADTDAPLTNQSTFSTTTGGWTGNLALNTRSLSDWCRSQGTSQEFPVTRLWLQLRVQDPSGYDITRATIRVQMRLRALPDQDLTSTTPLPAGTSAAAAAASAAAALVSENAAASSASSAASSASTATTKAAEASSSASAAATSASNASDSESNAATSAAAALVSKNAAASSASDASDSATTATGAASSATSSASSATTSAATATTKASEASDSATAAASSATDSATSATASATSATESATSATESATSATAAASSATAAAASESAAASSAASASSSASDAANAVASQYIGTVAGDSVPSTATAAGYYYIISSAGTSQTITWAVGDLAVYNGSSGDWSQLATSAYGYETQADANPKFAARGPRQGVTSDGTTYLGTTANGPDLALADFSIFGFVAPSDWSPGTTHTIWGKWSGSVGAFFSIRTSGELQLNIGGNTYISTEIIDITNERWGLAGVSADRDGNAIFTIAGEQLGNPVDISGSSATSLTTSEELYIGAVDGGTSNKFNGSIGELGVVNGITTVAQFAQIHANGTAVGTIDAADMYQHLVPTDLLAAGIFEDISGNNNHAALGGIPGENGIDTVLPVELPQETVQVPALRADTSQDPSINSVLNNQAPTDGDFLIVAELIWPEMPSATGSVYNLTDSTSNAYAASALLWDIVDSSMGWRFLGTDGSSYRRLGTTTLHSMLEGLPVVFGFSRDSSAASVSVFLQVGNLPAIDVTNLFSETTSGASVPNWDDAISADNLLALLRNNTQGDTTIDLRRIVLYNASADTLAEAADAMSPTPVGAKWQPVGDRGVYESDFSAGADGWTEQAGGQSVLTGNVDGVSGEDDCLQISRGSTGVIQCNIGDGYNTTEGIATAITFDYYLDASSGLTDFGLSQGDANRITPTEGSWQTGVVSRMEDAKTSGVVRYFTATGNLAVGKSLYLKNARTDVVGQTVGLNLSDGGGYQPKNPRFSNGSSHWEMSTDGITRLHEPKYGYLQTELTWAGTHEAKQITADQSAYPAATVEWIKLFPTASTSGSGATVGTVNDPDQFITATALTGGTDYMTGTNLTLQTAFPGGTAENDLTFVVDPDTSNYTGTIEVIVKLHWEAQR